MSAFKTVVGEAESVTVIERSKFICIVKGVETEADAKEFINSARKKYPLANHYCYAYIADEKGLIQKFSDDGEPHGTAGLPILNAIKGRELFKITVVVVRYFGGIKLGTGGLSRAYGGACCSALDSAKVCEFSEAEFFTLTLTYPQHKKIASLISDITVNTEFGSEVTVKIAVRTECESGEGKQGLIAEILNILGQNIKIKSDGTGYYAFRE